MDLCIDNAKRIMALESKCEELCDQIDRLTKEKETAFEEIECLKDQVKLYNIISFLLIWYYSIYTVVLLFVLLLLTVLSFII